MDSAEPAGYSSMVIAGLTSMGVGWASPMEIRETAIVLLGGAGPELNSATATLGHVRRGGRVVCTLGC